MIISMIAALSADSIIGYKNAIPWHLSADLAWFKRNTLNKTVIMGRKTFDSIGKKPLKERKNIIISRSSFPVVEESVIWVTSIQQALASAGNVKEVMIIGGAKLYNSFLSQASRLYLTHIFIKVNGDTWFPKYEQYNWRLTFSEFHCNDIINPYSYCFEILDRY